jgi:hypothetical protein
MIQPDTWKAIADYASKSWAAIGPLIGVLVGAYLTGRRQKRDWLADNKKEEYRELLSAMTKALSANIELHATGVALSGDDERRLTTSMSELMEVTRSRLFVAKQLKQLDVVNRWWSLASAFEKSRDHIVFARGTRELLDEIVETALKDVSR